MENHQKEMQFVSRSIFSSILRGILVGIFAGLVVVSFRLAIEKVFQLALFLYQRAQQDIRFLGLIIFIYLILSLGIGWLIKGNSDIKGSGIPQVEAELKGLMHLKWCSVLWRKFLGGVLAIGSGLMLGREGPSIQLGAVAGKGVAAALKTSEMEKRSLIASGAAAGLSAAFNAPIAGLLFIVEEVYHQFSNVVWVSALAASITANFISLQIFGLKPVLDLPGSIEVVPLSHYGFYIGFGVAFGLAGWCYEWVILRVTSLYRKVGNILHLKPQYFSLLAFLLILPIGYFFPELLGGGHHLILHLPIAGFSISVLCLFTVIRFVWSMISYGSGLPGGIFLPILTLGSLLGMLLGQIGVSSGFLSQQELVLCIVLGMAGFFAAISKAPLTAMILVTEMVGDLRQLMVIAVVSLTAYVIMDWLKGAPIYEAMLEAMLPEKIAEDHQLTLLEVVVSEKLANKTVSELELPYNTLITSRVHHGKTQIVTGNTHLHLGDRICIAVYRSDIHQVRKVLED